jgi:hypothetical protein
MTEQIPSTPPATDGAAPTEVPMVAGAGETFDALDSSTPLSAGADEDGADQGGADQGAAGQGDAGQDDAG